MRTLVHRYLKKSGRPVVAHFRTVKNPHRLSLWNKYLGDRRKLGEDHWGNPVYESFSSWEDRIEGEEE